jgi:hypothetical protein
MFLKCLIHLLINQFFIYGRRFSCIAVAASLRSAAMTELSFRSCSEFVAKLDFTVWKTTRIPEYMHCLER